MLFQINIIIKFIRRNYEIIVFEKHQILIIKLILLNKLFNFKQKIKQYNTNYYKSNEDKKKLNSVDSSNIIYKMKFCYNYKLFYF